MASRQMLAWYRSPPARRSRGVALLRGNHVFAEYFFAPLRRRHHHRELAAIHHRYPIGQREHFVKLGAHQEDRLFFVARFEQLLVNELDRADVDAASRLRSKENGEAPSHLTGYDDLLLIAARKRARG